MILCYNSLSKFLMGKRECAVGIEAEGKDIAEKEIKDSDSTFNKKVKKDDRSIL